MRRDSEDELKSGEYGYVSAQLNGLTIESDIFKDIIMKQVTDNWLTKLKTLKEDGQVPEFESDENGVMKYKGRWCISHDEGLKTKIMNKSHNSPYSDKMYKDLKRSTIGGPT